MLQFSIKNQCQLPKLVLLIVCTLIAVISIAQQINIQVVVTPPYSNKLEDYIDKGNSVIITVTNTSPSTQQFKLIPTITGNNGVLAAIREDFLPVSPISMAPGESRTFNYNQLRVFNNNLQRNDLIIQGMSLSLLENTGTLPEGSYTICIKAIRYGGTEQLSGSTGGCAGFLISAYDPPIILVPQNNATVKMPQPQLLNFQWTPSGISGKTRYTIKIADITSLNIFNPNDAFNNPYITPYFQQSNIITSAFAYDMSKPKLFKDRQYAVQIIAYDPEGKLSYKNDGKSQAHLFKVGDLGLVLPDTKNDNDKTTPFVTPTKLKDKDPAGGGGNPPTDPSDSPDCMNAGACQMPEPSCGGGGAPAVGATVNVGKFKMKITQIQGGNGSGEIDVPYLQTKVDVAFQNLTVNANNEICGASMIWAKAASQDLIPQQMLQQIQGAYSDQGINWQSINQHIQQQNKKVSLFNINQTPKNLPFLLDLGPGELTILGMVFTPTAAYANVAFSAPVPVGNSNQHFSMGMKGVCIRPNGFGIAEADARMTLPSQLSMPIGQNIQFVLEGGANGSYVKFDCKGVKEVKLKGGIELERSLVLPVDNNMNVVPAPAKFKVNFDGVASSIKDWMVDATSSHPAMTTAEGNGFKIGFEKLIIDFSKTKNPQGMNFPTNHPLHNSPVKSSWTGVILSNPVVNFPDYLRKSDNKSIKINVSSIVLDGEGLWTKLAVENVIDKLDDGSFGGWGFAIYQFHLDIQKSELKGGGLAGAVNIPITEVGVGFDATYQPGTQNKDMVINFGVNLQDGLDIDMIFAQATLNPGSELKILIEGGKAKPNAILHGSLTIGWNKNSAKKPADDENNDVASFELPTVNFQGLSIFNGNNDLPNLNLQAMQLANLNAQGKLGGFPIKLAGNPGFQNDGNGMIGFNLGLEFILSKANPNGLKGSTDFTIFAKYNPQKRRFAYEKTQLNCISMDNLDIAVATLSGGVCLYKDDPKFGNGFSGRLDATIKGVGVGVKVALGVGNVDNYDYFYFEGLVKLPGIPISTTMSLYGFGGGFHYNMDRAKIDPIIESQYPANNPVPSKPGPGYSPSGVVYTPKNGTIGFNATVVFGLSGGVGPAAAFNGDLSFWMTISDAHGIEKMGFEGNGYLVQSLNDRGGAIVHGKFEVQIDFVNKAFDMGVNLQLNLANVLTGQGTITMHASPNEWFIYLGRWDTKADKNNYEPWNDKERINLNVKLAVLELKFNLYFMMGSIVPELPPLPGKILQNLQMQGGSNFTDTRSGFPSHNEKKPGFAFGGGFHHEIDINILIFYANIEFFAGFDLMFVKKFEGDCAHLGINGWRAEGQAYAYLGIEAGLRINLWIYKGEFKLIDIKVAAMIYAQFTNPNYVQAKVALKATVLNGLIKVNKQVNFEVGKKAQCSEGYNPFADMPIIENIYPENDQDVEVYDDIRLAFNYPKGKFKVFNEEFPDEPANFYYYKIAQVSLKKGNTTLQLANDPIYTKDGYGAKFSTYGNEFYPEKSQLKFNIKVEGYKIALKDVKLVEENYTVNFNTKAKPDYIPVSQMRAANPTIRQRYFLSESFNEGYLLTEKDFNYLLNKNEIGDPEVFDQSKTEFIVQFFETGSGKKIEIPLYKGAYGRMEFYVPENLKPRTIYKISLLARLQPKAKQIHKNQLDKFDITDGGTGIKESEITQGAYKVSRFLLPQKVDKTVDHVFASWFFQTSMYKRLSQKLADYKADGSSTVNVFTTNLAPTVKKSGNNFILDTGPCDGCYMPRYTLPVALITGKEAFDQYDLYGYNVGKDNFAVQPIIRFLATDNTVAHHTKYYADVNNVLTYIWGNAPVHIKSYLALSEGRDYNHTLFKDHSINDRIKGVWPNNFMTGTSPDMIWTVFNKHKQFFTDPKLPNGKSLWVPEGPLSQKEIDDAMAATMIEKEGGSGLLNIKIKSNPPAGNSMMNQGMGIKSNLTPVYAMVNIADFLALHDYNHIIRNGWYVSSNNFKGNVKYLQDTLWSELYRTKGNYKLKLGNLLDTNKSFDYNWNQNKPNKPN